MSRIKAFVEARIFIIEDERNILGFVTTHLELIL